MRVGLAMVMAAGLAGTLTTCGATPYAATRDHTASLSTLHAPRKVRTYQTVTSAARLPALAPSESSRVLPRLQRHVATNGRARVYWSPERRGDIRGVLGPDRIVELASGEWTPQVTRSCRVGGWAPVVGGGWICLGETRETDEAPQSLPPTPHDGLPFLYGQRRRPSAGRVYRSPEAYAEHAQPLKKLDYDESYAFQRKVETPRGAVFIDLAGRAIPEDEVALHEVSPFRGHDLVAQPVPEGHVVAWTVKPNAPMRTAPSRDAELGAELRKQQELEIVATPVDGEDGHWFRVVDGLGPGKDGFMNDRRFMHHMTDAPRPSGVTDDELWVDVDVKQQVLTVRMGDTPQFATLVSTGHANSPTPLGIYRVNRKRATQTLQSPRHATQEYRVERVPWVMAFKKYYALHGAYWHSEYGRRHSHGCVNLSVADAAYLYDQLSPDHEPAFHFTREAPADPGSVVQIRSAGHRIPDKRE